MTAPEEICPHCQEPLKEEACTVCGWPENLEAFAAEENQLKTLKDIIYLDDNEGRAPEMELVEVPRLRAELGVRWVKRLRDWDTPLSDSIYDHIGVILILKHIFNLTEDDLKNG